MSSPSRQMRRNVESSRLTYCRSVSLRASSRRRRPESTLKPMKIGWSISRSSTLAAPSARLGRTDVSSPGPLDVGLTVEGDLLSFAQGFERDRLALAAVEEDLFPIGCSNEAKSAVRQFLDLSDFHWLHLAWLLRRGAV